VPGLFIVPADADMSGVEIELSQADRRSYRLRDALAAQGGEGHSRYDYVLIDCPPSLKLLTQNAIAAATHYIVPVESGAPYAINGLDDLKRRVEKVMLVNPTLNFLGALLIKHDERQTLCRENEKDATKLFGKLIPVKISTTAKVNQSITQRVSVRMAERNNKVSKQYQELADYIATATAGQGLKAGEGAK